MYGNDKMLSNYDTFKAITVKPCNTSKKKQKFISWMDWTFFVN